MAKGQTIGYIRVSSFDQNDARQREAIGEVDRLFADRVSGKDTNREQLQAMLSYVREGDTIIIQSMDRLARNLDDLRQMIKTQTKLGICIRFIREGLTFTGNESPMDNLMLSVLGAVAQFERDKIKERQAEGIALARRRGVYKGRRKALSSEQIIELKRQAAEKTVQKTALAREFGIARNTLYQYLKDEA